MARMDRDTALASAEVSDRSSVRLPPPVELREMLLALKDVLHRAELFGRHAVQRELLSVRERMTGVLTRLGDARFHAFTEMFMPEEGRLGLVVTFIAILELVKERLIEIVQDAPLAPIYLKSLALIDAAGNDSHAPDAGAVDMGEAASVNTDYLI